MLIRSLNKTVTSKIGETVLVQGWINSVRSHGKVTFFDLRDRSSLLQVVTDQKISLKPEDVVAVEGTVVQRPEKLINTKISTGNVELQATTITILSESVSLPFETGATELGVTLPTLLDYRCLTLRHPKIKEIFQVQAAIMEGFRLSAQELGCTEIFVPTISASSTEGGAEVFKVKYYDHEAFMTQSPQLYKQMLVPVYERVFTIAHAYRAEPSVTSRHLSESTQMDCELGFVEFEDLLSAVEFVGKNTLAHVVKTCGSILADYGILPPQLAEVTPRLTMREAQAIILERTGIDHTTEKDLMPEDEREICRWALEKHGSDFVNITHYPTKKRAFYTMPDPKNPEFSLSYDLLYRGVEILSGSQRINKYDELVEAIRERGMDPENFKMYLQAFEYGMPPEGGFSFGLERMTMLTLGLSNVREASLFPRDMERVDFRLSTTEKKHVLMSGQQVYSAIIEKLKKQDISPLEEYQHEAVLTSEEASRVRGTTIDQGAKALVMLGNKKPILVVVSASTSIDSNKLKHDLGIKDLKMASPEEVESITGLKVGSIPPFGSLFGMPTHVDSKLKLNSEIVFNAGLHTQSIRIRYSDWERVENPKLGEFSKTKI